MSKLIYFAFIFNVFSVRLAFATDLTLENILNKIETKEKNVQNIRFNFYQDITYTLTDEKQSISGEVIFLKPENIKIIQRKPIEQIITTNGKKVWIYTPEFNQVIEDEWKNWINNDVIPSSLLNFCKDWKDLKNNYNFNYMGKENENYVLKLSSKEKNEWNIKFWINEDNYYINKSVLEGENIIIETKMNKQKINENKINKNIFKFEAPKNVEVLKIQ